MSEKVVRKPRSVPSREELGLVGTMFMSQVTPAATRLTQIAYRRGLQNLTRHVAGASTQQLRRATISYIV